MFDEVFELVLRLAAEKQLLSSKTVGVDSTTLEANAAMKSIVRKVKADSAARRLLLPSLAACLCWSDSEGRRSPPPSHSLHVFIATIPCLLNPRNGARAYIMPHIDGCSTDQCAKFRVLRSGGKQ